MPKPSETRGIVAWGMWIIFWCNINTLFFCSQHTGTLGHMGIPGFSTMFLGISAVGVIPGGCASRSGSRCRGGGFNLSIGKCLIFYFFVPSARCLRLIGGYLKNGSSGVWCLVPGAMSLSTIIPTW